jgi:hypothetical protein
LPCCEKLYERKIRLPFLQRPYSEWLAKKRVWRGGV